MTSPSPNDRNLSLRAAKGASWQSLAVIGEYAIALVTVAILARLLTPAEFGLVTLALSFLNFAKLFSELALPSALVRQREIRDGHINTSFIVVIGLGIAAGFLIAVPSRWLATFFGAPQLEQMLWAIAILVPVNAASSVSMALLSRQGAFQFIAMSNFPGVLIGYCLTSIVLALLGFGAWALIAGVIVQQVIATVLRYLATKHSLSLRWDQGAFKDFFAFSSSMTVSGWINYAATNGDKLVVGRMLGLDALGFYGRAYKLMMLPVEVISAAVFRVIFPSMSSVQDDAQRLRRAYTRGLSVLMALLVPVAVVVAFAAKPIVLIVLGTKWMAAVAPTQILLMSLPFRAAYRHINLPTMIKGGAITIPILNAVYAILIVGGSIVAALVGGDITAVSAAVGLAIFIFYLGCAYSANRLMQISWLEFGKLHWPAFASGLALTVCLPFVDMLPWAGIHPAIDLLNYTGVAGAVLILLYFFFPKLVVGTDNLAFLSPLARALPVIGTSISRWMDAIVLSSMRDSGARS